MTFKASIFSIALVGLLAVGCSSSSTSTTTTNEPSAVPSKPGAEGKTKIAFVTNNTSDFWKIAQAGINKAGSELPKYEIEFKMPADGTAASQKQILDDLVANGTKAIAVSVKDPKNQSEELSKLAEKTLLITHDSDAPDSKRECYIGTDNVAAGKMAGEEIKKALPNGGKIMVFVGSKDDQNAKERYQGLQDAIKGSKVTIIDIRTDETDRAKAKQNVADAITANADLAGCVGLWSYNTPAIVGAVKEAKKEGKIMVVGFDEEADTLAGIKEGVVFSTIVQQPYEFGYQSAKLMAKVLEGDKSGIPADKKIIVPTKVVDKASVEEFEKKLKEQTGK